MRTQKQIKELLDAYAAFYEERKEKALEKFERRDAEVLESLQNECGKRGHEFLSVDSSGVCKYCGCMED